MEILQENLLFPAILVLPYFAAQSFSIFGQTIHVFTVLVGLGILTGFLLAVYRGRRFGFTRERIALFSLFLICGGLMGARLGRILYQPDLLLSLSSHPGLGLLGFHGISSFGAYFGGLLGALAFFCFKCASTEEGLSLLDTVGFALPFSWFLGRVGCALVHDHPGILSTGWLTIAFPDGPRYDLGLLEAMFLLPLACVFLILDRRKRPAGFYFACYFSVYGPFRFLLDQLHVDPPRYFGWSVDQYGALLATTAGLVTWILIARSYPHRSAPENSHEIYYGSLS